MVACRNVDRVPLITGYARVFIEFVASQWRELSFVACLFRIARLSPMGRPTPDQVTAERSTLLIALLIAAMAKSAVMIKIATAAIQ